MDISQRLADIRAEKTFSRLDCDDPLLSATEAAAEAGRARSTFWRDVKSGVMPPPIYVLPRAPRWRKSEIQAAIEACRAIKKVA